MAQKILAIDDSHTLRRFITRSLQDHSADYQVITAKDGEEGIELARKELPDLILLDFVLPDIQGDAVCEKLSQDPSTRNLPIVLMSSSAKEIQRTEEQYESVRKALAKPFAPELLCATISHVMRELAKEAKSSGSGAAQPAPEPLPAKPQVTIPAGHLPPPMFAGNTSHFPLQSVLNAVEQDALTGMLRLEIKEQVLETYFTHGQVVLVTTRDTDAYEKALPGGTLDEANKTLPDARKLQAASGCPILLKLAESKAILLSEAMNLCHSAGLRLFARMWTSGRVAFSFHPLASLPDFALRVSSYPGSLDEFAMESLRLVGADCQSAIAWGEPTGVPAYTRAGYDRIQNIPLTDEEWEFSALVSSSLSLQEIAERLQCSVERAQEILYRFLALNIFDYWPVTALKGE